ncbi:adenine deaminase [Vulcanimicrobium alpinum]|uniref:Adenine deaminase n=1 Tax=Vulcanimicrobium alpinum TaxID=3016050 RepID=A0AAN2CB97_UNVUL|nr:adenosine deaminase [Vulcanimicrobium alpinum]BDE07753.1 adenine deaminase [Vulcanimicrobium alpinum]
MNQLAFALPKAELHLHIEGTFEPGLIFTLAERNGVQLPYPNVDALRRAYAFTDLRSFLDVYYAAMAVLRTERDFTELADAYLSRAREQGVVHVEMFFDPQAHTARGIPFATVIDGLWEAVRTSEARFGISASLIMCFLRDQSEESAFATLDEALPYGDRIVAVGLDSAEVGHPPSKFRRVFERALAEGWKTVAHAGEEGPPAYVWEALDLLRVSRVDHGVRSLEDPRLVARLRDERIPLTVCPLSNVKLRVVDTLADHPLRRMLDEDLVVTVNSDDPAYFGGYIGTNYAQVAQALHLDDAALLTLARNSFEASFIDVRTRDAYLARVDAAVPAHRCR